RPSDPLYLFGARQHQFQHGVDGGAHVGVGDDRHAVAPRAPDDVVLDTADVVETVDVLRLRTQAVEPGVADHEVRAVLLLVVDGEHALDDERTVDPGQHPGHEVDALEHHRPALL